MPQSFFHFRFLLYHFQNSIVLKIPPLSSFNHFYILYFLIILSQFFVVLFTVIRYTISSESIFFFTKIMV